MYAVIKTGGKQYRVAPQDIIKIEKVGGDVGEKVEFDEVLMLGGDAVEVGSPLVEGAVVTAEVVEQGRARKIIVFKKKRRQNYRRKKGHRQHLTTVRITDILTGVKKAKSAAKDAGATKGAAAEQDKPKSAPAAKEAGPKDKKADAPKSFAPLEAPEGQADDLKKISGVGPKLEEKLNALGIFHFWQIAAFSADDVVKIDDQLNFKGRIERDDWIGQAKTLMGG